MISAKILDAGTTPVIDPLDTTPGMTAFYWNEADFETDFMADRQEEINAIVRDAGPLEVEPWPVPLTRHAPIDDTERYEATGDEGLILELYRVDHLRDETPPAPAGEVRLDLDSEPATDPNASRITREKTWREIQAGAENPTEWLRLDSKNVTGGTRLKDPVSVQFRGLVGQEFRLVVPDQMIFAPFDLRYPERYYVRDDDGRRLDDERGLHEMSLQNGGDYTLYLRPRRWRYVATVIAHYLLISPFEVVPMDEFFIRAHFHRPPYYPYRHNIIESSANPTVPNYYGDLRSYDEGVNWQWEHSRAAGYLAQEIIDAQFYTLCLVKIFIGNEDADVTISQYPPEANDVVLGIGRRDRSTGREVRRWVCQKYDLTHVYPWTVISQNLVPFRVVPETRELPIF